MVYQYWEVAMICQISPKIFLWLSNYFLYNELIKEFSDEDIILDFEGSDIPGVSYFYNKFSDSNQQYAFVKFKDRFEIHSTDGSKTVIKETIPLAKGRGIPKNLIWLNDDYMVIFGSTYGGYSGQTRSLKFFSLTAKQTQ